MQFSRSAKTGQLIVQFSVIFLTGQIAKKPDCPVKNRTPGNHKFRGTFAHTLTVGSGSLPLEEFGPPPYTWLLLPWVRCVPKISLIVQAIWPQHTRVPDKRSDDDVTKHRTSSTIHTGAKCRSWVLVKCVWYGAYY